MEIENVLGFDTYAVNLPIGCGKDFKGVYDRSKKEDNHFNQPWAAPGRPPR